MQRLLIIPASLLALSLGAMFWSGGAAGPRADFSFINRGDNKCLDPNGMSWLQDIRIAYALWEGLYTLDPATLKPVLGTADRVEVDASKTVYTFHIREAARWSNGNPVTAGDFVFAWRRMLETPGEYTYLHHYIKNAKAYEDAYTARVDAIAKGETAAAPDFSTVGERAIDARTLRVELAHPVPFFPSLCAFPPFFPLHERSMRRFATTDPASGQTTYSLDFTRPPNLVSNGPYRMAEWSFKRRLRMVASDYYWDRAHVKSRTIDQVYDEEPLAAFRAYNSGMVDWLSDVDPDLAANILKKGGRDDLHVFPGFGTYYYELNCQPKLPDGRANPFVDVRVRQALGMSIDKTPIVRDIGRLGQPVATTFIPPGVFRGFRSPAGLPYDVAAARKLLADAGYPGGRGFPRLSILYNTESIHGDVAQVIRRQWLTNLGIDVDLEGVEVKVFGARLHTQQFSIARASWYGDYDDPSTFTDKYKSDSDDNNAKWSSPAYDALCAAAETETDPAKRFDLLSRAEAILLKEAPILPIYGYVNAYLFRPNVTGLALDAKNMVMFNAVTRGGER